MPHSKNYFFSLTFLLLCFCIKCKSPPAAKVPIETPIYKLVEKQAKLLNTKNKLSCQKYLDSIYKTAPTEINIPFLKIYFDTLLSSQQKITAYQQIIATDSFQKWSVYYKFKAYFELAFLQRSLLQNSSSTENYILAFQQIEPQAENFQEEIGSVYYDLAHIQGKTVEKFTLYKQAAACFEKAENYEMAGYSLFNAGNVLYELKDFNNANLYAQKAIEIHKLISTEPDEDFEAFKIDCIAKLHLSDSAFMLLEKPKTRSLFLQGNKNSYYRILVQNIITLYDINKIDELKTALDSLQNFYSPDTSFLYESNLISFGRSLVARSQKKSSLEKKALQKNLYYIFLNGITDYGFWSSADTCYGRLIEICSQTNNSSEANYWIKKRTELDPFPAKHDAALTKQLKFSITRDLKSAQKIIQLQNEQLASTKKIQFLIGGIILLLLLFIATIWRLYLQLKDHRKKLAIETVKLDAINKNLEKKRILISEQKIKQEQLLTRLEKSNENLSQFAAHAAQDLKSPLNSIAVIANQLKKADHQGVIPENEEMFQTLRKSTKSLQKLIQDLLLFSSLGKNLLTLESIDLNVLLEDLIHTISYTIEERNATVIIHELPTIKGHYSLLTQLFLNPISNSLKFIKTGVNPHIEVSSKKLSSNKIEICIQDNGIGIAPKHFEEVLKPFKKLHSSDIYEGSGIGLAICTKIVTFYKGKIWLESELNKGTKVKFILPN